MISIYFTAPSNFLISFSTNFFSRKKFIENNFADEECRTYENLDALRMQVDNTDSASLHFDSILEGDINQVGEMSGGDGPSHGFLFDAQENYDIPRINANPVAQCSAMAAYENTNVINNDIEHKRREVPYKYPRYAQEKNELTDNALFNKFRESADCCTASDSKDKSAHMPIDDEDINANESNDEELTEGKLKDSNSVSCEDLLEFANKKPNGKERGIESDEVRIMTKVLGTSVSFDEIKIISM